MKAERKHGGSHPVGTAASLEQRLQQFTRTWPAVLLIIILRQQQYEFVCTQKWNMSGDMIKLETCLKPGWALMILAMFFCFFCYYNPTTQLWVPVTLCISQVVDSNTISLWLTNCKNMALTEATSMPNIQYCYIGVDPIQAVEPI